MATEEFGDAPLDHLVRVMPPWYTGAPITECGRPVADVKSTATRAELKAKFAKLGQQRASFSTCMSCANLFTRTAVWEQRPDDVVERWVRGAAFRGAVSAGTPNAALMRRELLALGMLVEEHREEFEALVSALEQTEDLGAARRRARIRAVQS